MGGRRLANYLSVMTMEAQTIARACGKNDLRNLEPEDLCALTVESAAMAIAADSTVRAHRSSGSKFLKSFLPQALAIVCASIVITLR